MVGFERDVNAILWSILHEETVTYVHHDERYAAQVYVEVQRRLARPYDGDDA